MVETGLLERLRQQKLNKKPSPGLGRNLFEKLKKSKEQPEIVEKKETAVPVQKTPEKIVVLDTYNFVSNKIPISIKIFMKSGEFVPLYHVSITSISPTTEVVLERIRKELIREVSLGMTDIVAAKKGTTIEEKVEAAITILIKKYFPDIAVEEKQFLIAYLLQKSIGLGNLEIVMDDTQLEEVAINSSDEPVWVYHRKHGWLKTNITIKEEDQTKHYATMIGRRIGRQITVLEPLLDAHLAEGDRVNATLMPISTRGNTITLRKFARDPWTITKFLNARTISLSAAALIWQGIQYELSALIAGGTASGKTSMLNVVANFFPPNQRIISIEDTREIELPKFLHWVPMSTRLPNAEGKGGISMLDLLVNSLRQRPDRILVGEVRRKREAEVLFEAIHTGHSVYATFHANNAHEAITRLTNPPIEVPKIMLPAISMILVQFRNRRTGIRRTFQIAEIMEDGTENVIKQFDLKKDIMIDKNKSVTLKNTIELYTGYTNKEIDDLLKEKERVLKYLVNTNINAVDSVGRVIAEYYTNKSNLMKYVRAGKRLE